MVNCFCKTQTGLQIQGCELMKGLKELASNTVALFKLKQHREENKTQPHFQPMTESAECINRKVFWVVFCRAEFRIPAYSGLNCMEKSRHTQSADSLTFFWSAKNSKNSQWQSNTLPVWQSTQLEYMTNLVLTCIRNPGTTKQSGVDSK